VQTLDPGIFKAYDVRGVYGDQIDDETAFNVGRAFVRVLADLSHKPTDGLNIGLGRTCASPRPSSRRCTARG
jgi:phosphomannomutase